MLLVHAVGSNLIGYQGIQYCMYLLTLYSTVQVTHRKIFTMTNSLLDDDAYQTQMVDPWDGNSDYVRTTGNFGRTPATLS